MIEMKAKMERELLNCNLIELLKIKKYIDERINEFITDEDE